MATPRMFQVFSGIFSRGTILSHSYTFATLPSNPTVGELANVSDSETATWGASLATGGSTNKVLVRWNGANWTVVGK